jgi:DNA-binding NarL/FixJ family response regulator
MHLFIAHRSRLVSECLRSALAADKRFRTDVLDVSQAELPTRTVRRGRVALLVDLALGDRALELVRVARRSDDRIKVVVLVSAIHHDRIAECVCAGAHGCVMEDCSLDVLQDAIRQVCDGGTFCSPEIVWSMLKRFAAEEQCEAWRKQVNRINLTPREQDVLRLVAEHRTNKEIAKELSVSLYTVKNHVHNILEKLRVQNRQEAVEQARRRQWLDRVSLLRSDDEAV